MKILVNDLNRIVSIYSISSPLGRVLGVKQPSGQIIRSDLLNDLLSLMFYHEVISHHGFTKTFQSQMLQVFGLNKAMSEDLLKTITLLLANAVLNGSVNWNTIIYALVGVCIYHLFIRPIIINTSLSKTLDFAAVEDLAETIVLLSLDTGNIKDIVSKLTGLLVYHHLMKLN